VRFARAGPALLLALAAGLFYLLDSEPGEAQGNALELAVKATYLHKIAAFITWPPPSDPSQAGASQSGGAFNICIIGNDPFGSLLDQAIEGQTVGGRPIFVTRWRALPDAFDCQIAYVTDAGSQSAAVVLAQLRGKPVLTVTDSARSPATRGIVNFVIADNRVRFEIDNGAATLDRLVISSKLLSLAVIVRSNPVVGEDR
jgi:YfiR/HmsC-like